MQKLMLKKFLFLALLLVAGISSGAKAAEDVDTIRRNAESALKNKDYGSAAKLLTILHQRRDGAATIALASLYLDGAGVAQDSDKAISMLRPIANGSLGWGFQCQAINELGRIYEAGRGVKVNLDEAVNYYWKLAGEGLFQGAEGIARIYKGEKGISMLLNKVEGHNDKMKKSCAFVLGEIYEQGFGTAVDLHKAAKYYWIAATLNEEAAFENLASIFDEGKVVPKDWKEVYILACNGLEMGWGSLCTVAKNHMNGAQINAAESARESRENARGAAAAQALYNQVIAE